MHGRINVQSVDSSIASTALIFNAVPVKVNRQWDDAKKKETGEAESEAQCLVSR